MHHDTDSLLALLKDSEVWKSSFGFRKAIAQPVKSSRKK